MKRLSLVMLAGLLASAAAPAAVLRGTVVENQTGKMLARASVTLQQVGGGKDAARSVRTSVSGTFEFGGLAGGAYLLKVARRGFMPLEHGQKSWNAAGRPLFVDAEASVFLSLRMFRYAGVSGTVLDDNDVGLPDHEVIAYRDTAPPQIAARSKSNDRGVYRILGLEPGGYFIRTGASRSEEGSYIPTFARDTLTVDNARPVPLDVDQLSGNMDVRPLKGRLVTISGTVTPELPRVRNPPRVSVTVTLVTDTGRQSVTTDDSFHFPPILPGAYEIYAEAPADGNRIVPFQGAHLRGYARKDETQGLRLSSTGLTYFLFRGAPSRALEDGTMRVSARRKDLAGYGPVVRLTPERNRMALLPGVWEVMLVPPPGHYVSAISTPRMPYGMPTRPDVWNEVVSDGMGGYVTFTLSATPCTLSGTVKSEGEPVVGAPVFLEAWDETKRRRLLDLKSTVTDMQGKYTFSELAPGEYRVLSTFEYRNPDQKTMDGAGAERVRIAPRNAAERNLTLYVIR